MKKRQRLTLGDRVREVRQELELTQSEFGDRLNLSGAALSEIENDKYKPGHDFFLHMAKEFNVNLYYLFFGKGDMFIGIAEGSKEGAAHFVAKNSEVEKFLWHFERSPIVQYFILGQFRRFFQKEQKEIESDIKFHMSE
jgi:transcriptional regulator with XRE-family HTH domain